MDWRQRNLMAEAIYMFEGDQIIVELRYDDFRAKLLDGEQIAPFKGETVRCAYAAIGAGLTVEAVCLFLIQFDAIGVGQADWNLPVRELAQSSGSGPDLGAGPINLAGRGQCSVPWHNLRLWMPREHNLAGICQHIQATVTRNSLGFRAVRPQKMTDLALEPDTTAVPQQPVTPPTPIKGAASQKSKPSPLRPGSGKADVCALPLRRPQQATPVLAAAPQLSPEQRRELRTSGAMRALKQAEQSFEAAFGRVTPRVSEDQAQRARNLGAAIAQLRAAHARELAQIRSANDRTVASMKTEIQRLRAEVERLSRQLEAAESES
ncbi:MAG: hypothetical protein JJU22_06925 [Gammaproteobacteria bacterium]|nr:hypothetical protein [Gammaproteobacteria bacterium]